jgi:hypothetical protein
MTIPSQQLEVWSHIGAITASKNTYHSIKNCLENHTFPEGVKYDIYLQGSYGNSTNIRGDSDVDVVTELMSSFQPKITALTDDEQAIFSKKYKDATFFLSDFKKEVLISLKNYYDENRITEGNKAIKVEGYSGRLNADIIVAINYRYFWHVYENQPDSYAEGIAFQDKNGVWIHSYPKKHYENGVKKMRLTNDNYKPLVRIYKNIRGHLENDYSMPDKFLSSYFIESLVYNVSNQYFTGAISDVFIKSLKWLNEADLSNFKCQHGLFNLFGSSDEQCSISDAQTFISNIVELWNNW